MHTCKTKFVTYQPTDLVAAAISVDPKIKPLQIQGNAILTAIRKHKSWNEVKVVKQVINKRAILNEKIKQMQQTLPEGYEPVREYNLYTDEKDPLLI